MTADGPDPGAAAHRPWCGPECQFLTGIAEGVHEGIPWTLAPEEGAGRVELRLFERVGEDTDGTVGVLVSVTERRPAAAAPIDIESSAGLTGTEARRLAAELRVFAARCERESCRRTEGWD